MEGNPWLRRYTPKIDIRPTEIIELAIDSRPSREMERVDDPRNGVATIVPVSRHLIRDQKGVYLK